MNSMGSNSTCVASFFHGVLSSYRTLPRGENDSGFSEIAGRASASSDQSIALVPLPLADRVSVLVAEPANTDREEVCQQPDAQAAKGERL